MMEMIIGSAVVGAVVVVLYVRSAMQAKRFADESERSHK
jgi:hypothetical protein